MNNKKKSEAYVKFDLDGTPILSEFMQALQDNQKALEALETTSSHIPALCRLWIVHIVTTFEYLLRTHLKSETDAHELKSVADIKIPHKTRILHLKEKLSLYGIVPSQKILHDLEAIIYLRNYIIHGYWTSATQQKYISTSSFSTNINKFTEGDLHRFKHVYRTITDLLINRLLIRTSNDTNDLRRIFESLGITEKQLENIQSVADIFFCIFTAMGIPNSELNKCITKNDDGLVEIDVIKLDQVFESTDFDEEKLKNLHLTFSEILKKNLINQQ